MRILYGANPMRGCEIREVSKGRVPNGSLYVELQRLKSHGYVAQTGDLYRLTKVGHRVFDNFLKENRLKIATK
jgi:DNA-binding PadR family transcriptional regulator